MRCLLTLTDILGRSLALLSHVACFVSRTCTNSQSCTQLTAQQAAARFTSHMQVLQNELTLHAVQCSAQCIFKRPTAAELDKAPTRGETEGMKAGPVHQKCNSATETAVTSLYRRRQLS
jgi:hypothetical protein